MAFSGVSLSWQVSVCCFLHIGLLAGRVFMRCIATVKRLVKISQPLVMPTECSYCADKVRSRVTAVNRHRDLDGRFAEIEHRLNGEEHALAQGQPFAGAAIM